MSRVVVRADRNQYETWCRECLHFYWHADDCATGAAPPATQELHCPDCGTEVRP